MFPRSKTCSDIKLCNPKASSGSYVIDPDGERGVTPFTVFCNMTDKNKVVVRVISHDSEDRILVRESSFNMTRGDEDIEGGGVRKFLDSRKGGSEKIRGGSENLYTFNPKMGGPPKKLND